MDPFAGAVQDSLPGIAWRCDARTFQFTFVGDEADRVLGYPVERWFAERTFWQDHIHPDDREWALSFCLRAAARLKPYQFEYRMIAADGRIVPIWDVVHVVAEDGRPKELVGVMVDVTGRKRAEAELRESENSWKSMVRQAPDIIVTAAIDGTILSVNHTVEGYSLDQVVGTRLYDYLEPEWRETVRGYLETVFRTGEPVSFESLGAGPGGRATWWWTRAAPIRTEGRIVAATLIARDITVRRQAEDALRENGERQRKMLAALPFLIFRIRRDGTYLDCSGGRLDALALPPRDFLGKKIQDIFPPNLSKPALEALRRALDTGGTEIYRYDLPVPYPDGLLARFEAQILRAGQDEVVAVIREIEPAGALAAGKRP